MSHNASSNSSDAASGSTSQLATSPFSTHAIDFGPSYNLNLAASGRVNGLASDDQSLSSRASSFASGQDHSAATGSKGAPNVNLPPSSFTSTDATNSSACLFSFSDRIRNSSDHSRQSSGDAPSIFSATSAAARHTQSPLPQGLPGRNGFAPSSADSLGQSQGNSFGARSPRSLVPPFSGDEQQRRLSSSFIVRNNSPLLAPPSSANSGSRPPFVRQSFSDDPSTSVTDLLSSDLSSASMETRHGSFSGSFTVGDVTSPLASHSTASEIGQPEASSSLGTGAARSTGPLSASDPRTQLLVSNLPYRVRWQDLKDLFRKAGTVLRADVSLSADNRSRGYGTVLMATEQDAIKAADMLGGFTWQGRTLDVRVDRSGTLVGVAGSAVMPSIAPAGPGNGGISSPSTFGSGQMGPSPSSFSLADQGFNTQQQFLGVPPGFGASQGHLPGTFSGATSPSPLSPPTRAGDHQAMSTRASSSAHSDAGLGGGNQASEFERAMLQGHSNSGGSGTPNRQRPGSNFDTGFGGQPQHRAVSAVQSLNSSQMASRRGSDAGGGLGGASGPSAVWGAAVGDASNLYSQNAGGSSVPTGFPGATAMAPWPAGPGSLGGHGVASMQSQPFNSQMPTTSYAGRVLFVGNLPFHCQWQDLKDLFRAAGNIQRADVAIGPDGRSRGFGTVLFATQEDAQNAVRLYHGYEYSGRTLKVHFDRFAAQNGPAVGTPGNPAQYTGAFAAAALPSHMTNNVRGPAVPVMQAQPMQGGFGQYPQQGMQHQQQRNDFASQQHPQQQGHAAFGQAMYQNPASLNFSSQFQPLQHQSLQQQQQRYGQQSQQQHSHHQQQQYQQSQQLVSAFSGFADAGKGLQGQQSFSLFGNMDSARQNIEGSGADRRDSTIKPFGLFNDAGEESENSAAASGSADRENDYGMSITLPNNGGFGAASSYLPSDLMSPGLVSPPAPTSHPGRIQIPATNFVNSFGAALQDQMSPMIARMQVPMTPGMPGFTFHQVPETPPLYPQFLSPGLGPFSPVAGGNTTQMAMAPQDVNAGGFMNAAPGAPLGANFNPMFPASYGQGMQNQQPPTPHWSQIPGQRRGDRGGGSGANRQSSGMSNSARDEDDEVVSSVHTNIAKTPGAGPRRPSHADASNGLPARRASDVTPGSAPVEPSDGYPFPIVSTNNPLAHLTRRASMDSPAGTPLAGPGGSCSKAGEVPPSCGAGSEMLGTSTEELANTIARLSVKGTALTKDASGAAARRSLSMTAERSAAASAMAKLRERAGTPTPPAVDEESAIAANAAAAEGTGLGAPFSGGGGIKGKASPLAFSQVNAAKFLGLKGISEKALEVARNGSALDTRSEAGEGSKSGTPQDEHGAHQ